MAVRRKNTPFLNIYRCSNVMGFTGVLGQYEAKEQIR